MNLNALSVLESMLANWADNLRVAVAELQRLHAENAKMRAALVEIRDMVRSHPLYEPMTIEEEIEVGGDSARLCALGRVADEGLGEQDG